MNSPVVTAALLLCTVITLRAKEHCLLGDFEAQMQYLQHNAMMSPEQIANLSQVFDDVEQTLQKQWKGAKVIPYGSLAIGIALTISDADFYVELPNIDSITDAELVQGVLKLFNQSETYSGLHIFSTKYDEDVYLYTFNHNPTSLYCDMNFRNKIGVMGSRLFGYFINLDERIPPLIGVIKLWSRIHQLTGPQQLTNFGLYSLIMFYLQQKNMAPPVFKLQNKLKSNVTDNWVIDFEKIPYNSTNTEDVFQLLGGFFKYYSEFNFKEYIVSTFAGRPIHRSEFEDISKVPEEFSLYKTYMSNKDAEPLPIQTELCIQEVFEHNINAAERVEREETLKFVNHVQFAGRMFQEFPRDRFLRSILIKDQHNETFSRHKVVTVDKIKKLEDCI